MDKMRAAACTDVHLDIGERVQLLMQDYAHFVGDPARLNTQLALLTQLHGKEKIAHWQQLATSGRMAELVEELLVQHYDPVYRQSIRSQLQPLRPGDAAGAARHFRTCL